MNASHEQEGKKAGGRDPGRADRAGRPHRGDGGRGSQPPAGGAGGPGTPGGGRRLPAGAGPGAVPRLWFSVSVQHPQRGLCQHHRGPQMAEQLFGRGGERPGQRRPGGPGPGYPALAGCGDAELQRRPGQRHQHPRRLFRGQYPVYDRQPDLCFSGEIQRRVRLYALSV